MSRATRGLTQRRIPQSLRRFQRAGVVALLGAATLLAGAGCGAAANGTSSAPVVQHVASATLTTGGKGLSRPLPPDWEIELQVWFPDKQSTLRLELGSAAVMVFDGSHTWHRVQVTTRGVVVDARHTGASPLKASRVTLQALHAPVQVRGLLIQRSRS